MTTDTQHFGDAVGEVCWRDGCNGVIAEHSVHGCSCHISPPCSACTTPREYCPTCGWEAKDDAGTFNEHLLKRVAGGSTVIDWSKPRPLDPRKIDYHTHTHSNSSQLKKGVYPPSATREEVEAKVRGTFGGRFEHFGDGKFTYIAYTD